MLEKIKSYIQQSHDEVILYKKWDIRYSSPLERESFSRLWPFNHKYYFEANPSFIHEYKNFSDMSRYPLIMLRDGLIPILSFFLKNPRPPERFNTYLLIPRRFSAIIPKLWLSHIAVYEFEYKNSKNDIKTQYVVGLANNYNFWRKSIPEVVHKLQESLDLNKKIKLIIPIKEKSIFMDVDETSHISGLMKEFYKVFGDDVYHYSSHDEIMRMKFDTCATFCDLVDEPLLIFDNYLNHLLSHGNCSKVNSLKSIDEKSIRYSLSKNHQVIISEVEEQNNLYNEIAFHFKVNRIPKEFMQLRFHNEVKKLIREGKINF